MKKILLFYFLLTACALSAQVLEVPTLKSKGIVGKVLKVETATFQFIKDKGLTPTQEDVEVYDEQGRLKRIERNVHTSGLRYIYTYTLNKKGLLSQVKITNPTNNQTVRTIDYAYKKGLLVSTTQVQGTVTNVKNYSHNKSGYLIGVEVLENGVLKGAELYRVDDQGRRIRKSQKLPTDEVASTISTFTYVEEDGLEVKTEVRNVNGVKYEIVARKDLSTNRSLKETTKNLSNSQSGFNDFLYVEDANGSWVKGEVLDNQFGRSRLILRKITYADGTETGRIQWSLDDDRARYYRRNDQFQVALNGRIIETGTAENLPHSTDRLVYSTKKSASILLKGYDEKVYQNNWHQAEVISHAKDDVFWTSNSSGNSVNVYLKGKKLSTTTYSRSLYSYIIGGSAVAYLSKELRKSFVAREFYSEENKGKLHRAELSDEHHYWGKTSDTTYILAGYGSSIALRYQAEDSRGNNLVKTNSGDSWYVLPSFRKGFDEGKPGDIFPAVYLKEPAKELREKKLFNADFSSFKHDNLKNNKYRLKSADGLRVTNLTVSSVKTSDDELITYFPLTGQYLKMDQYYTLADDTDFLDQPVSVLLEGSADGYYIYNDGASIDFYKRGVKVGAHTFGVHKLKNDAKRYGAVLYDSATEVSFGMSYDLSEPDGMGPMVRLPFNKAYAFLLKLEGGRWVIFQKGKKLSSYDYSVMDEGNAYYFFKGQAQGSVEAFRFDDYDKVKPGDFIQAYPLSGKIAADLSVKLKADPRKPVEEVKGKPNSFKRDSSSYWLWDANGEPVNNYLQWFGSLGTNDVLVQDTALRITYQLSGYMEAEVMEGNAKVVAGPEDNAVIKWGESNLAFLISGRLRSDVKRVYLNNEPNGATWSELVYEPQGKQTYLMPYPSKEGFYIGKGQLLPAGDLAMVLTKLSEGRFSIIRHGELDQRNAFKSGSYEGDLIYWTENERTGVEAYRFKGFMKGKTYDLFYPEIVSGSELKAMGGKIEVTSKGGGN